MHRGTLTAILAFSLAMPSYAQNRSQARSMVISKQGIVATSQTLASQAGAQILARGGNALDAAIAANAALGVVEPMSNGIGGDLFVLYWEAKTGKLTGINASGWSTSGFTLDHLKSRNYARVPDEGIDSVSVPGCVAGWDRLLDLGPALQGARGPGLGGHDRGRGESDRERTHHLQPHAPSS